MHKIIRRIGNILLAVPLLTCAFAAPGHAGGAHKSAVYYALRLETGAGTTGDGENFADWDLDGWIGTDEDKFLVKSEAERVDDKAERLELWAMYGRNISIFWDAQIGVRLDTRPHSLAYGVIGFEGLAPYFIETEAHVFVSEDGDVSARLRHEKDLLFTQMLAVRLYVESDFFMRDVPEIGVGAGLSDGEFGLQARYEFTRDFAPYIDLKYERKFGETSSIAKSRGEDRGSFAGTVGVSLLF